MSLDTRSSARSTILWAFIGLIPSIGALCLALLGAMVLGGCDQGSAPAAAAVASETPAQIYHSAFVALTPGAIAKLESGPDADLVAGQATIERVIAASLASECDFGADYSWGLNATFPHLREQLALARLLRADADRLLASGDREGAAERTSAILRMAAQLGSSSRTVVELVVSIGIAANATNLLETSAALGSTARRHELLEALANAEQRSSRRLPEVVRSDAAFVAAWLRTGSRGAAELGVAPRSPAEAARAATALEAIAGEAAQILATTRSESALAALVARAEREKVKDVFVDLSKLRTLATTSDERFREARRSLGG